jgi:hypothetical protein
MMLLSLVTLQQRPMAKSVERQISQVAVTSTWTAQIFLLKIYQHPLLRLPPG